MTAQNLQPFVWGASRFGHRAGQDHEPTDFPVYCPKVVALIGKLTGALGDRCLPVLMRRKTGAEKVKKARMREIEAAGVDIEWEQYKESHRRS